MKDSYTKRKFLLVVGLSCLWAVMLQADELVPLKPKLPLMIPSDAKNVAPGSKISSSDTNVTANALAKLTDGDKEAFDTSIVLLRKGTQYVQFDLGSAQEIFAIVLWHAHDTPKIYRNVIVQVADDA